MSFKLRFGIVCVQNAPLDILRRRWQQVEALGFDSLWATDHFVFAQKPELPYFESWTLLADMAAHTRKVRLGTLVTALPFRNPAFLARQVLTLDHISAGRIELGLGAGAAAKNDISYAMTGTPDWPPAERVERLEEALKIIDNLLRQPHTTFEGKYYRVQDAVMNPRSLQEPRPPILLAAMGKKMLHLAAAYADTWNSFGGPGLETVEDVFQITKERSEILDDFCRQIKRDPQSLRRSLLAYGPLAGNIFESADSFRLIVEKFRKIGISEFLAYYPEDKEQQENMQKISREVLPDLRSKD